MEKGAVRCPTCVEAKMMHNTRDMPYTYKGESTVIPLVTGDFCPACGEVVLGADGSMRISVLMLDFNKQVNASLLRENRESQERIL